MSGPAVKICGVCREQDAAAAADAGATYLGVILVPGRKRTQNLDAAARIYAAAPGLQRVGVFADASLEDVLAASERLALDVIQLHGGEPPQLLAALQARSRAQRWKAIAVRQPGDIAHGIARYAACADALVFDSGGGGSGVRFDWSWVPAPAERDFRLVLAGGLDPDNVASAVHAVAPDVVDVSSGVEQDVAFKDPNLIRAFVAAARTTQE